MGEQNDGEILDWKEAAIAWANGHELQFRAPDGFYANMGLWQDKQAPEKSVAFHAKYQYRIMPEHIWQEIDHREAAFEWGRGRLVQKYSKNLGWVKINPDYSSFRCDTKYRVDERSLPLKGDKGD